MNDRGVDPVARLVGSTPVPGLTTRRCAVPEDYRGLAALMAVANAHDDVPYVPTAENLAVELEHDPGLDPSRDIVLAEVDGRPVAASWVSREIRDGIPTYDLRGAVDPAWRRRGIGTWLLDWSIAHARARARREDLGAAVDLRSYAEERELGHQALLARVGFVPIRHFFVMRRPLADAIPTAPLPEGLEIRPVRRDEWRAIFEAEEEAFRDHWGHREKTDEDFEMTFRMPEVDTGLWVVAWDGDEVAGVVQNWIWPAENARLGVRRGWLEHISVRRPWRRRGLARAITAIGLERLREAGMAEAMLGVDSENANGALGLYEGLGFAVHSRGVAYRRPLDP